MDAPILFPASLDALLIERMDCHARGVTEALVGSQARASVIFAWRDRLTARINARTEQAA